MHCRVRKHRLFLAALHCIAAASFGMGAGQAAAAEPILIGMSTALTGVSTTLGARMTSGAQAYVEHINATGGVRGQRLSLVVLDDGGRAKQTEENVRALAQKGAVAILGCSNDDSCEAAARAARDEQIPLVAPLSGLDFSKVGGGMAFPIRPNYEKEADALARQLLAMSFSRVAVVSEAGIESPRAQAMKRALTAVGLAQTSISVDRKSLPNLKGVLAQARTSVQVAWVDVTPQTIEAMLEAGVTEWTEWPSTIASFSGEAMIGIAGAFKGRTLIFTGVVPNPEYLARKVTSDFNAQAARYAPDGPAVTFEGFETYLGARTLVEAIRRAPSSPNRSTVSTALRGLRDVDFGGFRVSFAEHVHTGSVWVETGMRTKNGIFIR